MRHVHLNHEPTHVDDGHSDRANPDRDHSAQHDHAGANGVPDGRDHTDAHGVPNERDHADADGAHDAQHRHANANGIRDVQHVRLRADFGKLSVKIQPRI
jgi:hypothetical protein